MRLRLTARWIAPVSAPPIRDGALLVDDRGRIAAVGPAADVPRPEDARSLDLGEAVLLPGLVNVHAHPELAMMRGLLEDLPFHEWIPMLMRVKQAARLVEQDFTAAARATCIEALAAGITTLAATEDSSAALVALREAGLRGVVFREVFGPSPSQSDTAIAALLDRIAAMRTATTDLVRIGVSPHAPYTVSDSLFTAIAQLAVDESLPLAVHIAESDAEDRLVRDGEGPFADRLHGRGIETVPRAISPIQLLERTGILALQPLLVHCVRVDAADIARIAAAGASVAHCPVANARLGNGIAPLAELLEAGVAVGLGTDSVAANNRLDILEEARFAQMLQRARLRSPCVLPPAALLRLATLDGARALGLERVTGSLDIGKEADLCAVRLDGPHVRPVHEPIAALILAARGADVVLTAVRGRILYERGRFASLDAAGTYSALDAVAERIRSSAIR